MEISVQDKTVFYGTGGRAHDPALPWVIFIHGAAMDHTAWALQARYFAHHGRNVVALDLPGHGRSEGPPKSTVGDLAVWVGDLIDALGADQAALVGHSLGSLAALELAARRPEKVRALALLGTAFPMPVGEALLDASKANDHSAFDMITIYGHAKRSLVGGNPTPGLWMSGGALRLLERVPPGVLHTDFCACNDYQDGLEAAANVSCPTLMLLGAEDKMTPPRAGKALAEAIEGSETVILKGCGHMMMVEGPDEVVAALRAHV